MKRTPLYGLMAEFDTPTALVTAIHKARAAGYRSMDAYSPIPVEEVAEALHIHDRLLPILVFLGGLAGCIGGFALASWTSAVDYPINVGGRPFFSWPAYLPITFECTVLLAAITAVFGLLALNGLPMPYHPVFNVPQFALATREKFFLCIEARDPQFDREQTRRFLEGLEPLSVAEVDD
jgi:Alternative complex III, ActD subunit